jgi:predicted ribosomally synthesized peptide with nif11-like leader
MTGHPAERLLLSPPATRAWFPRPIRSPCLAEPLQGTLACQPAYLDGGNAAAMGLSALEQFLAHVQADPALRRQVSEATTADEVSLLAQELGYPVSGSDLLRFSGRSAAGVRVTRIDHPGEYPGRYV